MYATPDATGELRWIVLENGRIKGGKKGAATAGYIDPSADF